MIHLFPFFSEALKEFDRDEKISKIFKKFLGNPQEILEIILSNENSDELEAEEFITLKRSWQCEDYYTTLFTFENCVDWFKANLAKKQYGIPALVKYKDLDNGSIYLQVFLIDNNLQLGTAPIRIINTTDADEKIKQALKEKSLVLFK